MPELDATVGGATANSFVSLEDANAYLDGRLNASAWTGIVDDATVPVVAPGALAGDTTVPVAPLTVTLATGDLLVVGVGQVIVVAAPAAIDDEAIAVESLAFDVEAGAEATVPSSDRDDKLRALIEATRELSTLEPLLQGYRVTATQALPFPRILVINTKAPWLATIGITGYPQYADTIIPEDWKAATIELALEFLKAGTSDLAALDATQNVTQETVGPITTKYAEPEQRATGLARFPRVLALIRPLFADAAAVGAVTVVRM